MFQAALLNLLHLLIQQATLLLQHQDFQILLILHITDITQQVQAAQAILKSSSSFSEDTSSKIQIVSYSYSNNLRPDYSYNPQYSYPYRDYGYIDYNEDDDYRHYYSPTHYRNYYGSPDYYVKYTPYLNQYETKRCNHYPPEDKLFYIKCPDF